MTFEQTGFTKLMLHFPTERQPKSNIVYYVTFDGFLHLKNIFMHPLETL